MTASRDPDRLIHDFLMEGRTELTDQVYDAVRSTIEHTDQRAVLGPWRLPDMNKLLATGFAAAAVIAVLLVGPNLLPTSSTGPGGQPPASAQPSDAPPTAGPPSAEPTDPADGFLPAGPFVLRDPSRPADAPRATVTVPATGWTSMSEYAALAKGDQGDPPEATIVFWSYSAGTTFDVYEDPCHWESTRPQVPAATPDEIAKALAAQPTRDASVPVDVTVGGYDGKHVTLHVPADLAFSDCDGGEFASYGLTGAPAGVDGVERHHQGPGQVDELWILDVEGTIMIIDAMSGPDTSDELVGEMRAIAESATFE